MVFRSENLGQMYPKELSVYLLWAEKSRGGEKSEKDFEQEMHSSCKEVIIYFLLFSGSSGWPALMVKFRGQFCSGSSNYIFKSRVTEALPPIDIFFFFFAVILRNKAGSAFQHNLFFISLSYDLFMITFNFNVYRFIFIIFPLGLLFPFVKIH